MLRKSMISSAVALLLGLTSDSASAAPLYDHVSSDVSVYGKLNFEKQVSKNRDKGISIVHFYKDEGKCDHLMHRWKSDTWEENREIHSIMANLTK